MIEKSKRVEAYKAGVVTHATVEVVYTIGGMAGLPVGTRIATNHNKVLILDFAFGREYWIEEGTLSPFYDPLVSWLPAIILPPVVEEGPHE